MDASAFDSALNALDQSWSALDVELKVWTAVIVLGVFIEIVPLIKEYREERREYDLILPPSPPKKPSKWKFFWEALGVVLVFIGVAGELSVHFRASNVETKLRSKSRELTSLAYNEAKASTVSAERAKLETARLYALTAPRRLTPEQQHDIANALRPFKGRKIVIVSHAYDPEGFMFAKQLVAALKSTPAGLDIEERPIGLGNVSGMGSFNTETGIVIGWPPGQKDFAVKVHDALDKIGHVRELSLVPMQGPDAPWVTVNWKPLDLP
jgi:hypothetical protein